MLRTIKIMISENAGRFTEGKFPCAVCIKVVAVILSSVSFESVCT